MPYIARNCAITESRHLCSSVSLMLVYAGCCSANALRLVSMEAAICVAMDTVGSLSVGKNCAVSVFIV